jgi:hypothetical protein
VKLWLLESDRHRFIPAILHTLFLHFSFDADALTPHGPLAYGLRALREAWSRKCVFAQTLA